MSQPLAIAGLSAVLLFGACVQTPPELLADATVQMHTPGSGELGVSTRYGVVFLGQGARSGEVGYTSWFDDGPSYEEGIVEPLWQQGCTWSAPSSSCPRPP